jgi:hypothetical protein
MHLRSAGPLLLSHGAVLRGIEDVVRRAVPDATKVVVNMHTQWWWIRHEQFEWTHVIGDLPTYVDDPEPNVLRLHNQVHELVTMEESEIKVAGDAVAMLTVFRSNMPHELILTIRDVLI